MEKMQVQEALYTSFQVNLIELAEQFYKAKKAEGISPRTATFYRQQLAHFLKYCEVLSIQEVTQITPGIIREFLLHHQDTGHSPGGLHAAYRVLKTFLFWFELEEEPDNWKNPIKKVKAPRVTMDPLEPVPLEHVSKLVNTCNTNDFHDLRDKALFMFLLDTGARARECTAVNLADMNLFTGDITIVQGKGGKFRIVFIGKDTKRAIKAYLKKRADKNPALWVTLDQERLSYSGLRAMFERRSQQADIDTPEIHAFRRAFAINMLRAGIDLMTLARLMGHTTLKVLERYLKMIPDDLRAAHIKGSPVDSCKP